MTKSLVELFEFIKSSQQLCQHFNSKVKVSYLRVILNITLLRYSFSLAYKHCFLKYLCLCSLFISEQS